MRARPVLNGDGARTVNPHATKCVESWWTHYAQPEQREHFIEAAKVRDRERAHQTNVLEAKRAVLLRTFANPAPPKLTPSRSPR